MLNIVNPIVRQGSLFKMIVTGILYQLSHMFRFDIIGNSPLILCEFSPHVILFYLVEIATDNVNKQCGLLNLVTGFHAAQLIQM